MFDFDKLAKAILAIIGEPLKRLADRLKALEERPAYDPKETDTLVSLLNALQKKVDVLSASPVLVSGLDPSSFFTGEQVRELCEQLITEQPKPEVQQASITVDEVNTLIASAVAAIPPPEVKNVDAEDVKPFVEAYLKGLAVPKDGTSVTVEDVRPMIEELFKSIPIPKDGVGNTAALIDRDGNLIITMSDGKAVNVGRVVGRDADMEALKQLVVELVKSIPKPRDGVDGLGLKDLTITFDGERTYTWKLDDGVVQKEFIFKHKNTIYRDVFQEGKEYDCGDLVTWSGSLWHCNKDAVTSKPGEGNGEWTLAAKRGRDGKEVVTIQRDPKKPVKKD